MTKVYVVVEEGYHEGYGSYPYLIGVFRSKEKAESILNNAIDNELYPRYIVEIEEDVEYPLEPPRRPTGDGMYYNDYPLGGYAE